MTKQRKYAMKVTKNNGYVLKEQLFKRYNENQIVFSIYKVIITKTKYCRHRLSIMSKKISYI